MKVSVIAILAAPVLVLGGLAPQSGPAAVAHHHQNVARGMKAAPAAHYHGKRGPAKARHCAARAASISLASVSSTSVLAHQTTTTKETTTERPATHRTTTTEKPKPTHNDDNNDSGNSATSKTYSGDGTFYSTGLNACGTYDSDSDYIAAVAHRLFDSFPGANGNSNENPICNQKVRATYEGKSVVVRITDRCGGCEGEDLDFSPSAFKNLASFDTGRIHNMKWEYI